MRKLKLLTLICFVAALALPAPAVNAAVDKVICVPWQGDIAKYHTTYSGFNAEIKGVVKTTNTSQIWYKWIYGDGTESSVYSTSGHTKYNLETKHVYTGAVGTPFTARLQVDAVDGTMANAVEDTYLLKIEENNLDARINIAIDKGLWYLYKNMVTSYSAYHTFDGSPYGVWSYSSYYASPTASVIHAFQINGHKETGDENEDPYVDAVERGFNWLFNGYYSSGTYPMLQPYSIGVVHGSDNPDSRPNGIGIQVRDYGYRPVYEGGMIMDAIVASGTPGADSGRDFDSDGTTDTYAEVLQDMVDMYAWGQCDSYQAGYGGYIGGWRYSWNQWPDNSACQWAAIGMIPAEEAPWSCTIPGWVKTYNNNWLNRSHQQWNWDGTQNIWGGFGYTSFGWGDALTPSGMVQLDFVGATTSDPRWVRCERWFSDGWKDVGRDWLDRHNVYAYYAFAKAMRLANPAPVVNFSAGTYAGFDWYRGGSVAGLGTKMGLAEKISSNLLPDGAWSYYGGNLGTAWCVIILKPVLFAEAPIACFNADPNPNYADADIIFDPTCSGHSAADKDISNLVLFEWNWDNDAVYDEASVTPAITTHSFPCATVPCTHPVTLRVTDDDGGTATYVMNINITNPPHPPVSQPKSPYMISLCSGETLTVDGSDSYDPDEGEHEAGCGACPDDAITAWDWDLTGAPFDYTDATGETVALSDADIATYFGSAGTYDIGLRVTDNSYEAYPSATPRTNLTDEGFAQVQVYDCFDAGLWGVAGCGWVMLSWDEDPGADRYVIYYSSMGPDVGFEETSETTELSKVMGSFIMNMDIWYRVMAIDDLTGRERLSLPTMVNGEPELCDPIADADGPYDICLGDSVTLDGSGSVAQIGTIITWEWDLDNDGEYDDAIGETVSWTPSSAGTHTVGLKVVSSDSFTLTDSTTTTVDVSQCVCADNLAARAKDAKIQLTWDVQAGADSYNVYRSTTSGGPYTLAGNVITTYCTYLDTGLTNGIPYYYVVSPVSDSGEICQSEEVSATPIAGRTRRPR